MEEGVIYWMASPCCMENKLTRDILFGTTGTVFGESGLLSKTMFWLSVELHSHPGSATHKISDVLSRLRLHIKV